MMSPFTSDFLEHNLNDTIDFFLSFMTISHFLRSLQNFKTAVEVERFFLLLVTWGHSNARKENGDGVSKFILTKNDSKGLNNSQNETYGVAVLIPQAANLTIIIG
jgi:hypothetical protein